MQKNQRIVIAGYVLAALLGAGAGHSVNIDRLSSLSKAYGETGKTVERITAESNKLYRELYKKIGEHPLEGMLLSDQEMVLKDKGTREIVEAWKKKFREETSKPEYIERTEKIKQALNQARKAEDIARRTYYNAPRRSKTHLAVGAALGLGLAGTAHTLGLRRKRINSRGMVRPANRPRRR